MPITPFSNMKNLLEVYLKFSSLSFVQLVGSLYFMLSFLMAMTLHLNQLRDHDQKYIRLH